MNCRQKVDKTSGTVSDRKKAPIAAFCATGSYNRELVRQRPRKLAVPVGNTKLMTRRGVATL